jgi:nucleoid-associated protein YgaU
MPNEPIPATFKVQRPDGSTDELPVRFNPTELSFTKAAQFAEIAIPGIDAPIQQFVRGQAEKLTIELFFDTTDNGMDASARSVTELTDKFYALIKIQGKTHAPPVCEFTWNANAFPGLHLPENIYHNQHRHAFPCVVESVTQKFTLFSPQGVPLRATLSLSLREYRPLEDQLDQINFQTADHTRVCTVKRGDTLSGLAERYYDSPAAWRRLAAHNGITDPRRLEPGRVLELEPIL